MDKPPIKGDEVRHGNLIFLDALVQEAIDSVGAEPLTERMLKRLHDGKEPLTPTTAGQVLQRVKDSGELSFAVRLRDDKSYIGCCLLGDVSWQSRQAQLSTPIVSEEHYTTELLLDVIQTALQFAYWEANLNRIALHCSEDNTHLRAAVEQAGFSEEGRLRQETYRDGRYHDTVVFSMLQREWSS